jgi:hypothetical protein
MALDTFAVRPLAYTYKYMITVYNLVVFVGIRAVLALYLCNVGRSGYHCCNGCDGRLTLFGRFPVSVEAAVEHLGDVCSAGRCNEAGKQRDAGQQHGGLARGRMTEGTCLAIRSSPLSGA